MVEIGAGGGSIAHVDAMGRIAVGPESAGADPGPACYGRGGREPAVTDANLVLGRYDPARFAGGKTSSLVVGGRDGLPPQPGDLLPSPLYLASDANTAAPGATTMTGYSQFSDLSFLGSRDRRLDRYTLLPNSKCS